jgi:hypothetical protein
VKDQTRIAAIAAFVQAGLSLANLYFVLWVLPTLGLRSQADLANPVKALALARPLILVEVIKVLSALAAVTIVLAFARLLRAASSGRPVLLAATAAGCLAGLLLAFSGLLGIYSLAFLPHWLPAEQAAPLSANLSAWINRMGFGAILLDGLWALLANGLARKQGLISRGIAVSGMAWGTAGVLAILLNPLALLTLLLGLVWAGALAHAWLRNPQSIPSVPKNPSAG